MIIANARNPIDSERRVAIAPQVYAAPMRAGQIISVDAGPDEEVEWTWSHDPVRGSYVTGYRTIERGVRRRRD
jgi:hypothetical protein